VNTKESQYITPIEAKQYGIGIAAWYRLVRSGEIKSIRIGRKYVVPRHSFLAWYNTAGGQIESGRHAV
jgi:excisionase family DNA binding protein